MPNSSIMLGASTGPPEDVGVGPAAPGTQALDEQKAPLGQTLPHSPQLLESLVVSVHPLQSVSPLALHRQEPLWQVVPVSVQSPLVLQVGGVGVAEQALNEHASPSQLAPHASQ